MAQTMFNINELIPYNRDTLRTFLKDNTPNIELADEKIELILNELELTLFSGMNSEQLLESMILIATQNIQNDPEYDKIATQILLTKIYNSALRQHGEVFETNYRKSFVNYINEAIEIGLLDKQMNLLFDLEDLSNYLKIERDRVFKYIGLTTMQNRYMMRYRDHTVAETPQFLWMRVAMGLSLKEKNPGEQAKRFYDKLSELKYISGGSTLIGSGTTYPVLSNCFILDTEDDIHSIFDNVKNVALISKGTGGIGMAITKLRAEGSPIKTNNTFSSGPIPFAHVMDATIRAISRAGKKMGAVCLYMENWHLNFPEFLDLKQNAGDDYRRTRTSNTAVYISDEFMKRVAANEDWYLFDPAEVPELTEIYGDEFSKKYREYIAKAERGEMRIFTKIRAREQYKQILTSLQSTSHPWLTWKDTINLRALNNNTGTIHSSNLCTEVCLPQDRNNIAVCNLLYINLSSHVKKSNVGSIDERVDWETLKDSVRTGIRQLDNLIDVGLAPVPEAKNSDENNRAVGLGIMGFAESLEKLGLSYESEEAYELIDQVMEFVSYNCIEESTDLAAEKGAYNNFAGSMWSKGYVPYDTINKLEADRRTTLEQSRISRLDWNRLREKVKKGIRNATLMMIAPNASTGLVEGTSPGIDPRFAQIFSRATNNGKFLDINQNLVNDLKELGLWEQVREQVLASYGDISEINEIPDHIKKIYKTSFQVSPYAFIEVASRAQKWIDQSISRNMYLDTRDVEEMMDIYMAAWKKGLKTTYYLHMKPRHTAEQSTVKVNKSDAIGKKGFGFARPTSSPSVTTMPEATPTPEPIVAVETPKQEITPMQKALETAVNEEKPNVGFGKASGFAKVKTESVSFKPHACPIDPMERAKCEGCQ